MKKLKIVLSILLAIVFALPTLTASAEYFVDDIEFNDGIKNDGTWFYTLNKKSKTATICAYRGDEVDLVIPETVEEIYTVTGLTLICPGIGEGFDVFPVLSNRNEVETLTIPKTLEKITTDIVRLVDTTNYELVENGRVIVSGCCFGWFENLKEFIVDSENKYFSSEDGILFNKNKTALISYPNGKTEKSYTVPKTVTNILGEAFHKANFQELIITENVKKIGKIFDTPEKYKYSILNINLDKSDLKKAELLRGEVTVYKDSPAHKYFQGLIDEKIYNPSVLTVIDNPYIEEKDKTENKKEESKAEKTESKDTSSKKEQLTENKSQKNESQMVTSKQDDDASKTESLESVENTDNTVSEDKSIAESETQTTGKNNLPKIIIISVLATLIIGGGITLILLRRRKRI